MNYITRWRQLCYFYLNYASSIAEDDINYEDITLKKHMRGHKLTFWIELLLGFEEKSLSPLKIKFFGLLLELAPPLKYCNTLKICFPSNRIKLV